jgi:hypothetical protein
MAIKIFLNNIHKYLNAINLHPLSVVQGIAGISHFLRDRRKLKSKLNQNEWPLELYPCLYDRNSKSASLGEYFWQDLYVAKRIIEHNPVRHIDVGSRVDGFIAHIACVRRVEVFDIRPLVSKIENVEFTQWDITAPNLDLNGTAECVSCLHTLEHIGLGRYGDELDSDGWRKGLKSLVDLVAPGGWLWLSVPIGIQRVEFNAHRVFAPSTVRDEAQRLGMILKEFCYLSEDDFIRSDNIDKDFEWLRHSHYSLGIFYFGKKTKND